MVEKQRNDKTHLSLQDICKGESRITLHSGWFHYSRMTEIYTGNSVEFLSSWILTHNARLYRAYFKQSLQLHRGQKIYVVLTFLKQNFSSAKILFLTTFFSHSLRILNKKVDFHLPKFLTTFFSRSLRILNKKVDFHLPKFLTTFFSRSLRILKKKSTFIYQNFWRPFLVIR